MLAGYDDPRARDAVAARVIPFRNAGALQHVPLFASLSKRELAEAARVGYERSFLAGTELTREGEPSDAFYVMLDGNADVRRGGEQLNELGPGDFFGEIGLLGHSARTASVVARTDVKHVRDPGAWLPVADRADARRARQGARRARRPRLGGFGGGLERLRRLASARGREHGAGQHQREADQHSRRQPLVEHDDPEHRSHGRVTCCGRGSTSRISAGSISRTNRAGGSGDRPAGRRPDDVEELDVEPGRREVDGLRQAVVPLERQPELAVERLDRVELVEPERDRARVPGAGEEQPRLDVVRTVELVALTEDQLPVLHDGGPLLELVRVDGEGFVELNLDGRIGPFAGCRARLDGDRRHVAGVPGAAGDETPTAAILADHADVAQLARASACHAEGRGFESHHPLVKGPGNRAFLSQGTGCGRVCERTLIPTLAAPLGRSAPTTAGARLCGQCTPSVAGARRRLDPWRSRPATGSPRLPSTWPIGATCPTATTGSHSPRPRRSRCRSVRVRWRRHLQPAPALPRRPRRSAQRDR